MTKGGPMHKEETPVTKEGVRRVEYREDLPKGFVVILDEECKGCCVCVDACPKELLQLSDEMNPRGHRYVKLVDTDPCTGCGLCYVQCPSSAIIVYKLADRARRRKRA